MPRPKIKLILASKAYFRPDLYWPVLFMAFAGVKTHKSHLNQYSKTYCTDFCHFTPFAVADKIKKS